MAPAGGQAGSEGLGGGCRGCPGAPVTRPVLECSAGLGLRVQEEDEEGSLTVLSEQHLQGGCGSRGTPALAPALGQPVGACPAIHCGAARCWSRAGEETRDFPGVSVPGGGAAGTESP